MRPSYVLGHFTLAAKFAHDYEAAGLGGQSGELSEIVARRRRAPVATQALIDCVVDQIENKAPMTPICEKRAGPHEGRMPIQEVSRYAQCGSDTAA
jgi:hypothetical protein